MWHVILLLERRDTMNCWRIQIWRLTNFKRTWFSDNRNREDIAEKTRLQLRTNPNGNFNKFAKNTYKLINVFTLHAIQIQYSRRKRFAKQ